MNAWVQGSRSADGMFWSHIALYSWLRSGSLSVTVVKPKFLSHPVSFFLHFPLTDSHLSSECIMVTHTMPKNAPLLDCLPCLFIHLAPVDSTSLSWIQSRDTLLFWGGPLMSIAFCAKVIFWMLLPGSWLRVLLESTREAYPVPHHTPCAFPPTNYIATEPT